MKNSLNVASFSTNNKNKSYSSLPELEGFSNSNNNSKIYEDVYKFLNNNVDYEQCKQKTQDICSEYKFQQVDKVQDELNQIKKDTEKANQELMLCQSQNASCKQLYKEITDKTREFDNLHNDLIKQEKRINRCNNKKDECDALKKKMEDLEKLIETYEEEIKKLEIEAKKLFC